MTREEAKRHLEYLSVCSENHVTMAINSRDRQAIDMAIKALEQPEQRWIPITDHLPDEDIPVLVTDDAGGMATVGIDSCGRYEDTGERFWYTSQNVTAWMYTVKPYRGEQE